MKCEKPGRAHYLQMGWRNCLVTNTQVSGSVTVFFHSATMRNLPSRIVLMSGPSNSGFPLF